MNYQLLYNFLFESKLLAIALIFSLFYNIGNSQVVDIEWSRCLGGTSVDNGNSICQSLDSNYLISGYHWSDDGNITEWFGESDIWLVKLSQNGEILWQNTIGGSLSEEALSAISTNDSCFIISGFSRSMDGDINSNAGFDDCIIIKISNSGEIIWQINIGGTYSERATSIIKGYDDYYYFTGYSRSNDGIFSGHVGDVDYSDLIFGKIDSVGNLLWLKSFGGVYSEEGNHVIQTLDSNFIVVGAKEVVESNFNYYVLKVDNEGDLLWENTYGGSSSDIALTILESNNDRFWVSGVSYSDDGDVIGAHGSGDAWTLTLDGDGNIVSSKCFGGTRVDKWQSSNKIDNNTYCFAGSSDSDDGDVIGFDGAAMYPDYWIVALDSLGVIKWQDCFGGSKSEMCYSSIYGLNGDIVLTGPSASDDGDVVGYHEDGVAWDLADDWTLSISMLCEPVLYYKDFDDDGFGNNLSYIYNCYDTAGYVLDFTDCNDLDSLMSPIATELCNTLDDNCNGEVDEGLIYALYYLDEDDDGFGNADLDSLACLDIPGYITDSTDCNDLNPNIYPGAPEILNGLDDDCDGLGDEGLSIINNQVIQLSIHPSPATDHIIIDYPTSNLTTLNIYSSSGAIIYQNPHWTGEDIDVRNFPPAMYYLQLLQPEQVGYGCFVKE